MFKIIKFNNRFFVLMVFLLLISVSIMHYFDGFLKTDMSKNGILSFELAKESYMSGEIINSWNSTAKTAAGLSLGFDFLFLLIYASFLSMLIFKINNALYKNSLKNNLSKFIILSPFIAAFFDVIENIALIKLLLGDIQMKWSLIAYYFAIMKFSLLAIVISYILVGFSILIFRNKKNRYSGVRIK